MRTEDLVVRPDRVNVVESDEITLTSTETLVASSDGGVSCDLWVHVPVAWLPDTEIAVFGRVGPARVELARLALGDVGGTTASGMLSATCVTLRGRPCDAFEATIRWVGGGAAPGGAGQVMLQVFDADAPAVVEQHRPPRGEDGAPLVQRPARSPAVELELFPSGVESSAGTTSGGASCDVWIRIPTAWMARLEVTVYGSLGVNRVKLFRSGVASAIGSEDEGVFTGLAASIRSWPCDEFEVAVRDLGGGGALSGEGFATIQVFEDTSSPTAQQLEPPHGFPASPVFHRAARPTPVVQAGISLTTTETVVATGEGAGSCDVWVHVPDAWKPWLEVVLYGTHGSARVELVRARAKDAPGTSSGGVFSAVAASSRGLWCDTFEVAIRDAGTGGMGGTGTVRLQAGDDPSVPIARQREPGSPILQRPLALARTDSGLVSATTTEQVIATSAGAIDCDVWVRVPDAWKPDLEVALYGLVGVARVELARVGMADARGTSSGGNWSALAISSRGRRCDSFEVAWRSTSGSSLSGTGRAYVQPADVGALAMAGQSDRILPAVQSAAVSLSTTETVIASCGPASGCDVWVRAPVGWNVANAQIVLYGRLGPVTVELMRTSLTDAPGSIVGSDYQLVPISFRGKPCGGFDVALKWNSVSGPPSGTARVVLQPVLDGSLVRAEKSPPPTGSALSPLYQRAVVDAKPTFSISTSVSLGGASGTVGYLWKSSSATKALITRIRIHTLGKASYVFSVERLATEPSPAGTTITAFRHDDSLAPVVVGRSGGTSTASGGALLHLGIEAAVNVDHTWESPRDGDPIVLRGGVAGGLRVFATFGAGATATVARVQFEWVEI